MTQRFFDEISGRKSVPGGARHGDGLVTVAENPIPAQALLGQFQQFSLIFDSLSVLVYVADMETHELLFMNSYGAETFGPDFAGKACYEVLQAGQATPCDFCTNDLLIRDGSAQPPHVWEFQNTRNGSWFLCIDQAIPWVDGRLVRMEVAVDITAKREAEAEREQLLARIQHQAAQLDATISAMADGVVLCGTRGEILYANQVAGRLLGYTPEQKALPLRERFAALGLRTPAGRPLTGDEAPCGRALEYGETVQGLIAGRKGPAGGMIWMSMGAAPIRSPDGTLVGAVGTFTDITPLHELQQQREDYLHMVSHDLRNPLTPIMGLARWLERRLGEQNLSEEAETAELISSSAWRLHGMIEDLVHSARVESGHIDLNLEEADTRQLVSEIAQRMGTAEDRARIRLAFRAGTGNVSADRGQIERVVVNLLTNALKYSLADSPVLISVDEDSENVVVTVQNEGPGIPTSDLAQIFERYYRSQGGKKTDGLGLGLYIARFIVQAHGGRIWAESIPGQTTTFSFTLPKAP
jgi:signal transduction histidine kinase